MSYFSEYRQKLKKEEGDIQKRLRELEKKERVYKEKERARKERVERLRKQLETSLKNDTNKIEISINYTIEHCGSCCGDSDSDHQREEYIKVNLIEILWYLNNYLDRNLTKDTFFQNIHANISDFLSRYYSHPSSLEDFSFKVHK